MNAFEKLCDLLAACILMFAVPLLAFYSQFQKQQYLSVSKLCENFLQDASTNGKISRQAFEDFDQMLLCLQAEEVEIIHERSLFFPTKEGTVQRTYTTGRQKLQKEAITNGFCVLLRGDQVSVTLRYAGVTSTFSITIRTGGTKT